MTSASGFPASLPFTLILERDTALEEVVTVTAISGTNVTAATRGVDGTSAVAHSSGAAVEHGVSARDFNEPQAHIAASDGVHGLAGTVVGTSDTQTLTNKTLTGSATLDAASTIGGVSGTSLAADRTAWTSYTPTFTNLTSGGGNFAYKLIGKTLFLRWGFNAGTATNTGALAGFSLPAGITVPISQQFWTNAPGSGTPGLTVASAGGGANIVLTNVTLTTGNAASSYIGSGTAAIEVA